MSKDHEYHVSVHWTGNTGSGTNTPAGYSRDHEVAAEGKPAIAASSDPAFRGDAARWNPEELLVASLSQCHMLWYLGLCARAGIVVTAYEDAATGVMTENADGSGEFREVVLHPRIALADVSQQAAADDLHHQAHEMCFIARSVDFPVTVSAEYEADPE